MMTNVNIHTILDILDDWRKKNYDSEDYYESVKSEGYVDAMEVIRDLIEEEKVTGSPVKLDPMPWIVFVGNSLVDEPPYQRFAERQDGATFSPRRIFSQKISDYPGDKVEMQKYFHGIIRVENPKLRPSPEMPDNEKLFELLYSQFDDNNNIAGLRAIWRHGCDAGMVAQ